MPGKRKPDDDDIYFWNWDLPDDDLDEQNGNDINWRSSNNAIIIMTLLFLREEQRKVVKKMK